MDALEEDDGDDDDDAIKLLVAGLHMRNWSCLAAAAAVSSLTLRLSSRSSCAFSEFRL
jgi:hypothetical protein